VPTPNESETVLTSRQSPNSTPSVVSDVLARLPDADVQRAQSRRKQVCQRLGALALVTCLFVACLGPQASNLATRTLMWLLAAAETWRVLVSVTIGGVGAIPLLSCLCLLAVSIFLWQQVMSFDQRGLR
jgi:hypothetical protein